jgi:pimeloyl-ACP methyl ester carboxylesterase
MRRRPATRLLPLLTVAAVVLGACSSEDSLDDLADSLAEPTTTTAPNASTLDTIDWGPCDEPDATDPAECAVLEVPLDHADPSGPTIELALARIPAGTSDRAGVVLLNPGGPGASGVDMVLQGSSTLQFELGAESFDLIGFDPRGVDRSGGIECLGDAELEATLYVDDTPDTPEEQAAYDAAETLFDEACQTRYGDTLRHYSTEAIARDMDLIRAAAGEERITYYGASYGTYLGAVYATLFPDRVRAMVLDAAFEPTGDTVEEQYSAQLVGFEQAFDSWVAWCEEDVTCAVHGPDVGATWEQLVDALDAAPVPAEDGRSANQAVLYAATTAALYSESAWPVLADAMAAAQEGDGTGLYRLADSYAGRAPDGSYPSLLQSQPVIDCASGLGFVPPDDPEALAARLRELAPRFGADIVAEDLADDGCDGLVDGVEPPELSYAGDAPVLVIGGTGDPATPFRWAEEMVDRMGAAAVLVTYTGEGHGFVPISGCVAELAAAVIRSAEVPDDDVVCEPDPEVPEPAWWDDVPVPEVVTPIDQAATVLAAIGLTPRDGWHEVFGTALGPQAAVGAYAAPLRSAGFQEGGSEELDDDLVQGVWFTRDGEVLSVVAIGPATLAELLLDGLVEPGGSVVVVSHFPAE